MTRLGTLHEDGSFRATVDIDFIPLATEEILILDLPSGIRETIEAFQTFPKQEQTREQLERMFFENLCVKLPEKG
jgi:hypothetical protein